MQFRHLFACILLALTCSTARAEQSTGNTLTIFGAASMKEVLEELAQTYEPLCQCKIQLSFAASGTLARQIERGAPANIYISANEKWATWLVKKLSLPPSNKSAIAGNELVIAAPTKPDSPPLDILLTNQFAMGEPQSVPAGEYAMESLISLGHWEAAKANAIFTENVRVSLRLVARGEVGAAIAYRSDLRVENSLKPIYSFPVGSHPPITYSAVLLDSNDEVAKDFVRFLTSEKGRSIIIENGFVEAPHSN